MDETSQKEVIGALVDENIYTYKSLVTRLCEENRKSDGSDKIYNTVELFAFGTYEDYKANKEWFEELNAALLKKLIKLTILSIIAEREGQIIRIREFVRMLGLGEGLDHYSSLNAWKTDNEIALDKFILEMIDENLILAEIDDEENQIIIYKTILLRESPKTEYPPFKYLKNSTVSKYTLEHATQQLLNWQENNLKPTQAFIGVDQGEQDVEMHDI